MLISHSWLPILAAGLVCALPSPQKVLAPAVQESVIDLHAAPEAAREGLTLAEHRAQHVSRLECPCSSLEDQLEYTVSQLAQAEAAEARLDQLSEAAARIVAQQAEEAEPGSSTRLPPPAYYTPDEAWEDTLPIGDLERAEEKIQAALGAAQLYARPHPLALHYTAQRPANGRPDVRPPAVPAPSFDPAPRGEGGGRKWSWRTCPTPPWRRPREAIDIKSISVSPDPPIPGQNVTVSGWGTLKAPVRQGSDAEVLIKVGMAVIHRETVDLCKLAQREAFQLQCPIEPGTYHLSHTVLIPKTIPRSRFNAHITAENHLSDELLCLDVSVDFSPLPF